MTDRRSSSLAIECTYDSASEANIIEQSLARELDQIEGDRARASLERAGPDLQLTIEATDERALRAGATTWFGLLDVAESTAAIVGEVRD